MRLVQSTPRAAWMATLLIRLMVGAVFLSEGLQKFLFAESRGGGRFEQIGFPMPDLLGYFVGAVETLCGLLVLFGMYTRLAAFLLLIVIVVAIITTKIPILLGHGFGSFGVRALPSYGFWSMAHEIRTDWSMLLGTLYLLLVGSGPLAVDGFFRRRSVSQPPVDVETQPATHMEV